MAVSITRYHRAHGGYPTWAQALTGIDPALLTPLSTPPLTWPLRVGARGRAWLTGRSTPPAPTPESR